MERLIEVTHVNGAWRLDVQGCEPILYLSGVRAEMSARRLASSLAEGGCEICVHVHDKQNLLVGDHRFYAC